jgi:hypothetical protein
LVLYAMINAVHGMMYTEKAMRNAPKTELMGPKNGMAKARNQIRQTTGILTRHFRKKLELVCSPAAFSATRNTGLIFRIMATYCIHNT